VGLRPLDDTLASSRGTSDVSKTARPQFKQYREKDGQFYFKLTTAKGEILIQSDAYDQPRDAAQTIQALLSGARKWTDLPAHWCVADAAAIEMALLQLSPSQAAVPSHPRDLSA
jgi:uncharacterized protein YegP (UPF0339 family)